MARQDNNDFLAAFAIGAALGVGATLLLRPDKPNPRKQLQKRLKPHMRKLRKSAARSRKAGRMAPAGRPRRRGWRTTPSAPAASCWPSSAARCSAF